MCERSFAWLRGLRVHYQPVRGYPEKIDSKRVEGFERILDTIISHTGGVQDATILDIGSNLGWFCFRLTDLGARTYGLELDSRRVEACKCLAQRDNYNYDNPMFLNENAAEWVVGKNYKWDWVILLNTIHHIFVWDEEKTWKMWNNLIDNSRGVFVMMRNSMKGWKLCDRPGDIGDAMVDRSNATGYDAYDPVHGRTIYVFRKD